MSTAVATTEKPTVSHKNMTIAAKRKTLKRLLEEANSSFITFEFYKLDGSERSMNVQPAALQNHLVEEYKNASTKLAVETRKKNNPNLLNVWDVQKHEIRSINMDTVYRVTSFGTVYEFEAKRPETKKV